jgi:probable HAF family extracellular repeat protein
MISSSLLFHRRATLIAGALLLFELAGASANAAPSYTWTAIVVPNTKVQITRGLNNLGQIAVYNTDGSTGIYRLGQFKPLPAPPAGFLVGASGINDAGVIVGFATTSDPHEQAFILKHGNYSFFSRPGWQNTEARSIGPSGLVVGISYQDSGEYAGWLYDPLTGTFTDVTPPGSIYTVVQGINRFGRITGSGQDDSLGRYAFTWQLGTSGVGATETVPFLERANLADGWANGRGINDAGVITGFTQSGGQTVGFVGSASEGYQLLVPPGGDAAGALTYCLAINNFRQVACVVQDALGNSLGAFLGSPAEN